MDITKAKMAPLLSWGPHRMVAHFAEALRRHGTNDAVFRHILGEMCGYLGTLRLLQ